MGPGLLAVGGGVNGSWPVGDGTKRLPGGHLRKATEVTAVLLPVVLSDIWRRVAKVLIHVVYKLST